MGCITFPNGDRIEGEWNDDIIINAKYTKGTGKDIPK